jgi:hypothetical protein
MKALSLTQPWASLVALEAKRVETRSWYTAYRGPLVIHAAKGFPRDCKELASSPPFQRGLKGATQESLPLGAGLCLVELVACVKTGAVGNLKAIGFSVSVGELEFGNFSEGRWAWALTFSYRFETPITAKGALGLWEWTTFPAPVAKVLNALE